MMGELRVGIHNIRGLNHKTTELKQWLTENEVDILALNETLKSKKLFIKSAQHKYIYSQPDKNAEKDRGVGFLFREGLDVTDLPKIVPKEETRNISHAIQLTTTGTTIQIATVYCPNGKPNASLFKEIMERNEYTIIMGDMNVFHENIGSTKPTSVGGKILFDLMEEQNYTLANDHEPNHICDQNGKETVKSLIFISNPIFNLLRTTEISDCLGSDHYITMATLKINAKEKETPKRTIFLYHLADDVEIGRKINEHMSKFKLTNESTCSEIDEYTSELASTIYQTVNSDVPSKIISVKNIGLPKEVREMIKQKRDLTKMYRRTRIDSYKTEINWLKKEIKKHTKSQSDKNWSNFCDEMELTDNQQSSWHKIKKAMGTANKPTQIPTLTCTDDEGKVTYATTTEEKIAEFERSIKSIFQTENDLDDPLFTRRVEATLHEKEHLLKPLEKIDQNFLDHKETITKEEIQKIINKSKNSGGPDKISPKMLKFVSPHILPLIFILFNVCLFKGYYPLDWKSPQTIFLNKPGKINSLANNFRTIQLINILGKSLERVVHTRMYEHARKRNLINPEQAAYQWFKSCNDKIFQLAQSLIQALKQDQYHCTVFMDVEKAFDKVWLEGLLYILIQGYFPDHIIRFIKSFLTGRRTFFVMNGVRSGWIDLLLGVPQGSVLSALLFILFVAFIYKKEDRCIDPVKNKKPHQQINKRASLSQFADDLKAYNASKHIDKLFANIQYTLDIIGKFCDKRKIKINGPKTKALLASLKKRFHGLGINQLLFKGTPVQIVENARFLGIIFDKNANFKAHVNEVARKATQRLSKLKQICKTNYGPNQKTAIRLYKVYIRSMFEYGNAALIAADDNVIQQWEVIQTKTLRYILNAPNISNELLLKLANVPTIKARIRSLATKWYRKVYETNNEDIIDFINSRIYASYDHTRRTPLQLIQQEVERQDRLKRKQNANS